MRRRQTRPVQAHKPPSSAGIDLGNTLPLASVGDAEGAPCLPKGVAFANRRAGDARLDALLADATAQAAPTEVLIGGAATGPGGLSLYEALTAQGSRVRVLHPLSVKARRGTTWRGTTPAPVEARLLAKILQRAAGPARRCRKRQYKGCGTGLGGGPTWWRKSGM